MRRSRPHSLAPVTSTPATALFELPIPGRPRFVGANVLLQGLVVEAPSSPTRLAVCGGMTLTLGGQ